MKKKILLIIGFAFMLSLSACISNSNSTTSSITIPSDDNPTTFTGDDDIMNKMLILKIDNEEIDVTWLDNNSVKALKELAKDGLTINMHEYGGFEQTGLIGKTITSNDTRINVVPGDIVLYNSNQISIFYNNSSWSYTKLGHINMTKSKLTDLLAVDEVIVTLTLK